MINSKTVDNWRIFFQVRFVKTLRNPQSNTKLSPNSNPKLTLSLKLIILIHCEKKFLKTFYTPEKRTHNPYSATWTRYATTEPLWHFDILLLIFAVLAYIRNLKKTKKTNTNPNPNPTIDKAVGKGCPPLHWGSCLGSGLCSLQKICPFWVQTGEFWCILGATFELELNGTG